MYTLSLHDALPISKTTNSPVLAVGKDSPSAARHPMRDFSGSTLSATIRRRSFSVTVDFIHTSSGCGIVAIVEGKGKIWACGKFPRKRKALIKRWLKNEEQRR